MEDKWTKPSTTTTSNSTPCHCPEWLLHIQTTSSCEAVARGKGFHAVCLDNGVLEISGDNIVEGEALHLEGHRNVSNQLRFCWKAFSPEEVYLVSCAPKDYIIRWNIYECLQAKNSGEQVKGHVIGQTPDISVKHIAYNTSNSLIALCTGNDIIVYSNEKNGDPTILQRHTDTVNCAEFCPHYESTLVSAGQDRVYMIWNAAVGQLLYESCIVSSSPFISLSMNPMNEEFVLGAGDGIVRFYDLSDGSSFKMLRQLDVHKLISRYEANRQIGAGDHHDFVESNSSVLAMKYVCLSMGDDLELTEQTTKTFSIGKLLGQLELLLVVTTSHLLVVNSRSLVQLQIHNICDPIQSMGLSSVTLGCIEAVFMDDAQLCDIASLDDEDCVVDLWLVSLLQKRINRVRVFLENVCSSSQVSNSEISVFASIPLLKSSPLRALLTAKPPKPPPQKKSFLPSKKGSKIVDQPITFRSKVRSSGYSTTVPKRTMFQPHTNHSIPNKPKAKTNTIISRSYPLNAGPIVQKKSTVRVDVKPTHVRSLQFSNDGQCLACACANQSGLLFRMPLRDNSTALSGHTGIVNSLSWSRCNNFIISGSSDCTARVWSRGQADSIMEINCINGNINSSSQSKSKTAALVGEVKNASFFYMDKFILLTSGSSILMYKYHLDTTKNDVKRYANQSRYKLACQMDTPAQNYTALSTINSFYSYIVIAGCSDKSIHVYDMNTATNVRIIKDVQTKPVHHITQNEGSIYTSLPEAAYDLFLSASASDGIKLWDLRANCCVRRYEAHVNRMHSVGMAFSRCGKFITTGSEDRAAYVYDIGSGQVVSKLTGLSDTVTSVAYHPIYAQLAAGTLDGNISLYEA